MKGLTDATGTILLSANERRVAEDRHDCYRLYIVANCNEKPTLQEPVKDPARLEWREVPRWPIRWLEHDGPGMRANAIIRLIHQANFLLDQQFSALERQFSGDFPTWDNAADEEYLAAARAPACRPRQAGGTYERVWVNERVGVDEVPFESGVFLLLKSRAASLKTVAEPTAGAEPTPACLRTREVPNLR